jgi:hypothetical protein
LSKPILEFRAEIQDWGEKDFAKCAPMGKATNQAFPQSCFSYKVDDHTHAQQTKECETICLHI